MLGILWTLLPLLVSAALLLIWAAVILIVVVRWVISQFQAEKAALAVVTLLMLILLPAAAGLLGHGFFSGNISLKTEKSEVSALAELVDKFIEGSPKEDESADEDAPAAQDEPGGA